MFKVENKIVSEFFEKVSKRLFTLLEMQGVGQQYLIHLLAYTLKFMKLIGMINFLNYSLTKLKISMFLKGS